MKVTRHPKGVGVRWCPGRWRGPSLVGGRVAVTVLPLLPLLSSAPAGLVISPCCQVGTEVLPRTHFSRGSARDPLSFYTPHLRFSSRSPQQPTARAAACQWDPGPQYLWRATHPLPSPGGTKPIFWLEPPLQTHSASPRACIPKQSQGGSWITSRVPCRYHFNSETLKQFRQESPAWEGFGACSGQRK